MIWTVDHTLSHIIPLSKLGHRSYLCTTIKNKTKLAVSKNEIILGTYKLYHTHSVVRVRGKGWEMGGGGLVDEIIIQNEFTLIT